MIVREGRGWVDGERDLCGFCLQVYVVELEVRCVGCDRAVCPMCVVRLEVSAEMLCPECGAERG